MGLVQRLGPFLGLRTATAGDVPLNHAGSALNVRTGDGRILPRYGYRAVASQPPKIQAVLGFGRLVGYGDDYAERREWVSIERRDGTIMPYSVDPATFARTEITDAGTALSLAGGDWLSFCFGGDSYWVNPGGATTAYRHAVGDVASWSALQDSAYVPVGVAPQLSPLVREPNPRAWIAGDSFQTSTYQFVANSAIALAPDGAGGLVWTGDADDHGKVGTGLLQATFAAPLDLSAYDYIAVTATGGKIIREFTAGTKVTLTIGGANVAAEIHEVLSSDRKTLSVVIRTRGVAGNASVQGIHVTFYGDPYSHNSGTALSVGPLLLGGTYMSATTAAARPWDSTYQTATIPYGVRYRTLSPASDSGVLTTALDASRFGTVLAAPGGPIGDEVIVGATPEADAPYSDDPTGANCVMDLLRAGTDGKWRVIATLPNTAGQSVRDAREQWEVDALAPITDTGYVAPAPAPVFSSQGFVGGVPFKGWVAWLRAGGVANLQHSAVGDAESLYSANDTTDEAGRAANFTLADDQADEPLGGVQAGDALLVLGRRGCYAQSGNSPSTMTPPRKLAGSNGGVGRFALCRFRGEGGDPGIAWLDRSGENVWLACSYLFYQQDARALPTELSAPIRGSLRTFLLDGQLAAFPDLALADARLDVDESTESLWVVLGGRAAILRPPSLIDGERQWEFAEYGLGGWTPYSPPVSTCLGPFVPGSLANLARGASTVVWQAPSGSDAGQASGLAPGLSTRWLDGSIAPSPPIPADATIYHASLTVRHRATSSGTCPTPIALSALQAATLALTPGHAVPTAFEDHVVDLSALGLTPAALNAGMDARVAYDAAPTIADAYDPANWTVSYSPSGSSVTTGSGGGTTPWSGGSGTYAADSGFNPSTSSAQGSVLVTAKWTPTTADAVGKPAPPYVVLSIATTLSAGYSSVVLSAQGSSAAMTTTRHLLAVDPATGLALVSVAMSAFGASSSSGNVGND